MSTAYKSPLHEMSETTATDYWNDSCVEHELKYAIEHGAVGATTNPVIVLAALKEELPKWESTIKSIVAQAGESTEDEVTWQIIETIAATRATMFDAIYKKENGLKGRLSIQTNPKFYKNKDKLVEQALHFATVYPNSNVKVPVTNAGVDAIEEITAHGISINATVSFTVPQSIAVAEAIERGLARCKQQGKDVSQMAPVCTIMVGRVDDWMKAVVARNRLTVNPEWLEWAGVAVMKNAYRIYRQRGYTTRLLAAAFRNHYHWSELIGGDMVISMPGSWAKRFNNSAITVEERIENEVPAGYVDGLRQHVPGFIAAYEENGMTQKEFDDYGATRRTLRQFLQGYSDLVALVRNYLVPNPDA